MDEDIRAGNSEFSVLEVMFPRTAEGVYTWPFRRGTDGSDFAEDARVIEAQRAIIAVWKRRIKAHQRRLRFRKLVIDLLAFRQQAILFLLGIALKLIAIPSYLVGRKHG
jgi:hypothetical protein